MSQTRRQNSACDQCRNRKVKCNIQPGDDKCQHCINKSYACTFVAQQETEKKRTVTGRRLVRNSPPNMPIKLPPGYHQYRPPEYLTHPEDAKEELGVSNTRGTPGSGSSTSAFPIPIMDPVLQSSQPLPNVSPTTTHIGTGPMPSPWPPSRATSQLLHERSQQSRGIPPHPGAVPYQYPYSVRPPPFSQINPQYPYPGLPPPPNAPIQDFLAYLFAPDPSQPAEFSGQAQEYLHARRRLLEPEYRVEFATELLEVYFQVYHPRVPIVNPTRFRSQFREALYGIPATKEHRGSATNGTTNGTDGGAPPSKRLRTVDESVPTSANSSFTETVVTTASAATIPALANSSGSASLLGFGNASPQRPIHRPLLACLLAWGSKFSDHALLVMDRQQVSREGNPNPLRSNISRLLVDRAREVAEQEKVFRIAKPENVVVCLLMEPVQPLQSYPPTDPRGIKCLWLNAGIRHLVELGVNQHPSDPVPAGQHPGDPDDWSCMVFCWWIVCISDALCSLYFKKKPSLSSDDYDLKEFKLISQPKKVVGPATKGLAPDPEKERAAAQEIAFMMWYSSAHDLAVCSRQLAQTLWTPSIMKWGIPIDVITRHVTALNKWRDDHLATVGANNDLQNIGDYVAAVSACTIDCSYHVMWIALSQAISDYGIKEVNAALDTLVAPEPEGPTVNGEAGALGSPDVHQIPVIGDEVKEIPSEHLPLLDVERSVATEALNSSTRIAGLAGVLASNGYMRLDPNAMHWPIYSAGRLLAGLGRQEAVNCIDGLNQNGYAYDESWTHAKELQTLYNVAVAQGGPQGVESLLHPYLDPKARASRRGPASPVLRRMGKVYDTFQQNVNAPYGNLDDSLKRKHSALTADR